MGKTGKSPKAVLLSAHRVGQRLLRAYSHLFSPKTYKAKAGDRFNIYSAGLRPDRIHFMVPIVMNEVGIDISDQYSKDVGEYLGRLTAACPM